MTRHPKKNRVGITETPRELVTDILSRVAAFSVADISNVKLSCKELKEIAEDTEVYRRTCLDKFPIVAWTPYSDEQQKFLNKCRESDNPEFRYREALSDFFNKEEFDAARKKLDKAVRLGHVGALYVKCILLLLSGDDEQERKGIELIRKIKRFKFLRNKMRSCRTRLKEELGQMWVKNPLLREPPKFCSHRCRRIVNKWSGLEEYGEGDCEACDADREVEFISSQYNY